jgi:hypothetical protein
MQKPRFADTRCYRFGCVSGWLADGLFAVQNLQVKMAESNEPNLISGRHIADLSGANSGNG